MTNGTIAVVIILLVSFLAATREPMPMELQEPAAIIAPALKKAPVVVLEYKDPDGEAWLWDTLNGYTDNPKITAAIIGYFWRESCYRSDAVAGWPTALQVWGEDHCKLFTEAVDVGLRDGSTKDYFIEAAHYQYGGFGLGQWSGADYLDAFYDFAQAWGTSIADAEMQCAFTVESMRDNTELWALLQETEDVRSIGWFVATIYDGTRRGAEYISQCAVEIYEVNQLKYKFDDYEEEL